MKILVDKNILTEAVAPLMGAVSNKNTLAAVEGILITTNGDDACTLTSFDLEKGFRVKIPAKVVVPGSYVINGARFNQIIRTMPEGEMEVSVNNSNIITIKSGHSEFELSAINGSDFPTLPEFRSDMKFNVNQGVLRSMIVKTSFAVAQNENRAALNGAYFVFSENRLQIVACDGNRLAVREQVCDVTSVTDAKPEVSFILPGKTLTELLKMLKEEENDIQITVTRRNAVFEAGGVLFFSRLIDGEYLDYNKFIPTTCKIVAELETETLIRSLERAFLVSEDRTLGQTKSYVKFSFTPEELLISSVSANGRVSDKLDVEGVKSSIDIGFNCRYLLDALRACDTEKVHCEMNTPLSCMVIKPCEQNEDEDFLYLVLPIRMKD
ncbi:MAG: DNA polymerase III subunit beta [Ruminococcaceae bacterium]|nr:DNA polymerase III subunit beta [Oscillospiraceae bacterium]